MVTTSLAYDANTFDAEQAALAAKEARLLWRDCCGAMVVVALLLWRRGARCERVTYSRPRVTTRPRVTSRPRGADRLGARLGLGCGQSDAAERCDHPPW